MQNTTLSPEKNECPDILSDGVTEVRHF